MLNTMQDHTLNSSLGSLILTTYLRETVKSWKQLMVMGQLTYLIASILLSCLINSIKS